MLVTKENIKREEIDSEIIWGKLVDFAKYAFNKSHSVAYAIIGYWTAWLWVYHKEEFLEYCLNYDTKKVYQIAIDKLKEMNYKFQYPSLKEMGDSHFKVKDGTVLVPVDAVKSYDSYVDFLFSDEEPNLYKLIYSGVCDSLTKDRLSLVELISTLLSKPKEQAKFMEPEGQKFTNLTQILDGLIACGAVVEYSKQPDGILVFVKRGRGPASKVLFHKDSCPNIKADIVKFDLKEFGTVRKGVLSDLPYINTNAIERNLKNIKERMYSQNMGNIAYYKMRDTLNDYMYEYFSNPIKNTFEDIYAILEDFVTYERSTKLILTFNDRQDIFYINNRDSNASKIKRFGKKSLVKLKMIYSPFINKRKEEFVYDFDIEDIELVEGTR